MRPGDWRFQRTRWVVVYFLLTSQFVLLFAWSSSRGLMELDALSYLELIAADVFMIFFIYTGWRVLLRPMDRSFSRIFKVTLWSMDRHVRDILLRSGITFRRSNTIRLLRNTPAPWIKYMSTDGFMLRLIPNPGGGFKPRPSTTVLMGRCIGTHEEVARRIRQELDASTIVEDRWMISAAETISNDFIRLIWFLFAIMFIQMTALLIISPVIFEMYFCIPILIMLSVIALLFLYLLQIFRFSRAMVSISD